MAFRSCGKQTRIGLQEARSYRTSGSASTMSKKQRGRKEITETPGVRPATESVPEGLDFLCEVMRIEDECETHTLERVSGLGEKAPKCREALGTCLSLLDRAGSCWWGCSGGDHVLRYMVGRSTNIARASLRLTQMGFYDEALALDRNLGEVANLMSLFAHDAETLIEWKKADEAKRRNQFSPVKVRLALQKISTPIFINEVRYSRLSSLSTHVTPSTVPQSHNPFRLPVLSSTFQDAGFLLCLNELALPVVFICFSVAHIFDLDKDVRVKILHAGRELVEATGGVTIDRVSQLFQT